MMLNFFTSVFRRRQNLRVGFCGLLLFGIIGSCIYLNSISSLYLRDLKMGEKPNGIISRTEGQIDNNLKELKIDVKVFNSSFIARLRVQMFRNMSMSQNIWSNIKQLSDKILISIAPVHVGNKLTNAVKDVEIVFKTKQTNLVLKGKLTLVNSTSPVDSATPVVSTSPEDSTSPVVSTTMPVCLHPVLPRFIIEGINGGLGNQMFSYASAYGIAVHGNRTMLYQRSRMLLNYFTLDAILVDECVYREAKHIGSKHHCSFDKDLFMKNLTQSENYSVGIYLQSWKYFEAVVPQIKKQFTFKAVISNKAQAIINKISDEYLKKKRVVNVTHTFNNITFVGIHVRRGDIVIQKRFIEYGYQVAPKEYIDRAMLHFTNNFTNVLFVVCSDNMTWAEANIKHSDVFYVKGNSPEVDMSVLIHCNHTIITTGTFGWWSGFLAGGITVYFKYPAKEGSGLRKEFSKDYADYFYPDWVGLE